MVCEFDDHPDYIKVLQRPDVQNFRAVHAIQTSTPRSPPCWRGTTPRSACSPTPSRRCRTCAISRRRPVTLFFAGLNRDNDWPPFIDAINAVAHAFGDRLRSRWSTTARSSTRCARAHKNFTPLCDYQVYQDILGRCEISFMPLLDTPFNRCKSDLKFIEAASRRVLLAGQRRRLCRQHRRRPHRHPVPRSAGLEQRLTRLVSEPDARAG